jgi:hypothetical protein
MDPLPKDVVGKIAAAEKLKTEGNEHFKAQAWKKAIGCYQRVKLHPTRRV